MKRKRSEEIEGNKGKPKKKIKVSENTQNNGEISVSQDEVKRLQYFKRMSESVLEKYSSILQNILISSSFVSTDSVVKALLDFLSSFNLDFSSSSDSSCVYVFNLTFHLFTIFW